MGQIYQHYSPCNINLQTGFIILENYVQINLKRMIQQQQPCEIVLAVAE